MNYRSIALAELNAFAKEKPQYTLAEILYSILRKPVSGIELTKDIKNLTDESLYTMIETVRDSEKPEDNG